MIENKNIFIVGGSSGIGLSLIKQISSKNNIYSASRNDNNLNEYNVKHIKYDSVNDLEMDTSILPEKIDGFVYCPGSINLRPFNSLKIESFLEDYKINFLGAIKSLKIILPLMQKSDNSSIVFFSTVAVSTGMPFHSSISSSKGAIEGLTRSLAAEFAPNIRVNSIAPSIVKTNLSEKFLNSDLKIEKASERHPLGRIGKVEEISKLAAYLLSDDSRWVTGQVINIDGGIGSIRK
ncbi:MAG: oxidoreductase [Flavobacteriaceae bacterium]|nr:oxidoreductase [Flavobacteriaceae bacterium]|tara:strand:+ start:3229 stop:3933 length:705 start_codon:yes stop_codon:yes gene_type:complete